MTRPRVAVVGAGPAGSTAARLLAGRGAEVRLFEAQRLPRPKTCGGGLTPKAQRLVPPTALEAVERRVERVELRGPHGSAFRLVAPAAAIAMVERDRFDLALVEEAARAGADVHDGNPVRELREDGSGVELRTDQGHWRADVVVAADGEPSGAARQLGLGGPARRRALALEVDVPLANGLPNDMAILDFAISGGYGWYFPKGDHANVGVGSYHPARYPRLRSDLARLADELGLDVGAARVQGHWIPQGLRIGRLASDRVVLAGDAAATADPLFGEGISYAILSGIAAAQTIDEWADGSIGGLRSYDGRLRAVLGPPLDRLDALARAAEVSIAGALFLARLSGRVREQAIDAIAGRRAPFAIDRHCELACACSLHEPEALPMALVSGNQEPARFRHCEQCTARCAA